MVGVIGARAGATLPDLILAARRTDSLEVFSQENEVTNYCEQALPFDFGSDIVERRFRPWFGGSDTDPLRALGRAFGLFPDLSTGSQRGLGAPADRWIS